MDLNAFALVVMIVLGELAEGLLRPTCNESYIKNGRTRLRQRGRWAKFVCKQGYVLIGEKNAFCRNGKWDVELPKCVSQNCPKPNKDPLNSIVLTSLGVLNFYCKPGFSINGPKNIYCDGGKWDNAMPTCIKTNQKPQLFCDFESSDICQWNQDLNHDMDWMRDQYKTPTGYSMSTGPSYDHTKGPNGNGYYMYLETSSRRNNDTARLISPIYPKSNDITCLEFWYHMHGRTIGTLKVYIRKISDPWELDPSTAVFSKSGNHGDIWLRGFIDLGTINDDYQVVIEGTRGNGYVSDIAIDDVKIIESCNYYDHISSTTEAVGITTEILKPIESCENRCGHVANPANQTEMQYIMCDCDETCYESKRCCPDYVDMCLDYPRSSTYETTVDTLPTTVIMENATTPRNYPTVTEQKKTAHDINQIVPNITSTTTSKPWTTSTVKTVPTTTPVKKDLITSKTMKSIIFLKPTTTPAIYRKTLKPITEQQPLNNSNEDNFENDVNTVPLKHDSELNDYTTPIFLKDNISIEEKEAYVERVVNDNTLIKEQPENLDKVRTGFSQKPTETYSASIFIVAIAIAIISALAILLTLVVLKYRGYYRSHMRSGNGDSQSDVRFLTADEVLDFSLDKDYDSL
ncbi:uncharacterized protein LOC143192834 [Rhynchophorus ferrugineus]|uniref:uncharacterized protein LOC143192834 n=1 Tax=Rhynchophorus ferrugineus TaxID=354439 RepID=UPI003FCCFD78